MGEVSPDRVDLSANVSSSEIEKRTLLPGQSEIAQPNHGGFSHSNLRMAQNDMADDALRGGDGAEVIARTINGAEVGTEVGTGTGTGIGIEASVEPLFKESQSDVNKLQDTGLKDFTVDHCYKDLRPGEFPSLKAVPTEMWFGKDAGSQRGLDSILSPDTYQQLARLGIRSDLKIFNEARKDESQKEPTAESQKVSQNRSRDELYLSFNDRVLRKAMNDILTTYCANNAVGEVSDSKLQSQGYQFLNDFLATRFSRLEDGLKNKFSSDFSTGVGNPDILRQRVLQFSNETGLKFVDEAGVLHYPGLVQFLSLSDEALTVKIDQFSNHVTSDPEISLPAVKAMTANQQEIQTFIDAAEQQIPSGWSQRIGRWFASFVELFKHFKGFLEESTKEFSPQKLLKAPYLKERNELLEALNKRLHGIFSNDTDKKFDSRYFLQSNRAQNTFFTNLFKKRHADESIDAFVTRCVTDDEVTKLHESSKTVSDFYPYLKESFDKEAPPKNSDSSSLAAA
ncbi:hypothetical protein HYV57_03775 [Candidatus Peregrinibacteria bacterium]|nr:hypothetical protein [Candidatus Peregrinibacteria bacterium]